MREANSFRGAFWGFSADDAKRKIDDLASVITIFRPVSFEFSVSRVEYANILSSKVSRGMSSPHFACANLAMAMIAKFAAQLPDALPVDFIFDQQDGVDDDVSLFFQTMKNSLPRSVRRYINDKPIFRDDKDRRYLPLQAADMLAWHIRKDHEIGGQRWAHPLLQRIISPDTHIANEIDRDTISKWAADADVFPRVDSYRSKSEWKMFKRLDALMGQAPLGARIYYRIIGGYILARLRINRLLRRL